MANTIILGDHLVIKKRFYGNINRGDIIAFKYRDDRKITFVARVVGLPGERVQIRDRRVYINSTELPEQRTFVKMDVWNRELLEEVSVEGSGPYRVYYTSSAEDNFGSHAAPFATVEPFLIPDDYYFVLGDNRDNSADSRFRGPVDGDDIRGKIQMIYFSAGAPSEDGEERVRWDRCFKKVN